MNTSLTVYTASAGSGKTFTLAVSYITLLVESDNPKEFRHILAVTFTNKATAEMKDRILQQLYGISHSLESSKGYLERVRENLQQRGKYLSDEQIRDKAGAALNAILHDYSNFRVETIDSFFQSILRSLAHELGMSANMQVDLNTDELVKRAVDRLIDSLSDGNDAIKTWILEYISTRLDDNETWNVTRQINNLAKCIFSEEYQNRTHTERAALNDRNAVRALRQLTRSIVKTTRQDMRKRADQLIETVKGMNLNFDKISSGKNWLSFANKMGDMKAEEMSITMKNCINDPSKILASKNAKDSTLQAEAPIVANLFDQLWNYYSSILPRYNTALLAGRYINELLLLGHIEDLCTEIAEENNQFTLSKTPALLSSMVGESDAPFVYERAGITFHHIMIDEFQDTSGMQWKNFRTLLLENASKGGHDLIVGDIKQSIYRWRNGDWHILHGIKDQMHLPDDAIKPLTHNFRSTAVVVNFNNTFFEYAAPALDAMDPGASFKLADIYSDVHQEVPKDNPKDEGYVRMRLIHASAKDYEDTEAEDMLEQMRMLHSQGLPYNKMAILVRQNEDGADLIRRFRNMNAEVQLISDEAFLLSSSVAVRMIIAALQVVNDTNDESPVNMRLLVQYYHQQILGEDVDCDTIYMDDYKTLLPTELVEHRSELAGEPLYLLCEKLYRILQLEKIKGQSAYMLAFMDEVLAFVKNGSADITTFLRAWDEYIYKRAIPSSQMPGVRIVSIHKSKGLEYHTVFLPRTLEAIESDQHATNIWCKSNNKNFDTLGSLPIAVNSAMEHSEYKPIYDEEHLNRRVDALNVLYVAFTRAECNLYIWGAYRVDSKTASYFSKSAIVGNLLKTFIDSDSAKTINAQVSRTMEKKEEVEVTWETGTPVIKRQKKRDEQKDENRLTPEMPSLSQSFSSLEPSLNFMQSNASKRFQNEIQAGDEPIEQEAWEVGIAVHRILSHIRTIADVEGAIADCKREGLIADDGMAERIATQLRRGFEDPLAKVFFAPDVEVFNECAIASCDTKGNPQVRRPDRVVMNETDIFILDYKLGKPHDTHIDQVRDYALLLKKMYPAKTVHGALWYILRNRFVEVPV